MSPVLCLFVLFFIHPAALRPAGISNDDLPVEGVIDKLQNGPLGDTSMALKSSSAQAGDKIKLTTRNIEGSLKRVNVTLTKTYGDKNHVVRNIQQKENSILHQLIKNNPEIQLNVKSNVFEDTDKAKLNCGGTKPPSLSTEKRSNGGIVTWTFNDGDYSEARSSTHRHYFKNYIEYGLNIWSATTETKFKYIPWKDDPDPERDPTPNILFEFKKRHHMDGINFDGPGNSVAHYIYDRNNEIPLQIHLDYDECWLINQGSKDGAPYGRTKCIERKFEDDSTDSTTFCNPDFIQMIIHQGGHALNQNHRNKSVMAKLMPIPAKHIEGTNYGLFDIDIQTIRYTRGHCSPKRVDAAFSNTNEGNDYFIIGPYTYKFKKQVTKNQLTVEQTWPRLNHQVWNGEEFIDEVFIHTDKNRYHFSGDKYSVYLATSSRTPLPAQKIGVNYNKDGSKYYGWCGLQKYDGVDAMLRFITHDSTDTYIFQGNLVYLWDPTNDTCGGGTLPKGAVANGWPRKIVDVFDLPRGLENQRFDTVFQKYYNSKIYFFYGSHFYAVELTKSGKWINKGRKRISEVYRNVCDVYMCANYLPKKRKCRSWDLTKEEVADEVQTNDDETGTHLPTGTISTCAKPVDVTLDEKRPLI